MHELVFLHQKQITLSIVWHKVEEGDLLKWKKKIFSKNNLLPNVIPRYLIIEDEVT